MRAMQTHMIISFMLVIIVASSTRAQKSNHTHNKHGLSIAIEEMEKANYFSFVMLINMLPSSTNPRLLANITFLMPRDRTLSKSNTIHQDSVTEFLLRHSIPSPLTFDHLNLIPNGSIVPSSLPRYILKITNGGRSNYFLNNVKIVSRDICNLGSIKCHGIDGILQSSSGMGDDSPQNNIPNITCPNSHNNSEPNSHDSSDGDHHDHLNNSRPVPSPVRTPTPTALPPTSSPSHQSKSDSFNIRDGGMSTLLVIVGLLLSGIGM